MARVEPVTPSGQHRRENERQTYGGERRWEIGAGERWTAHTGGHGSDDRLTDPESARWRREGDTRPSMLRQLTDELGLTKPGPKGYQRSDERIREDICERLWHDERLDVGEVSVDVSSGVVTLGGTVPERRMKHAIEDVAAGCRGVRDVDNGIRVERGTSSAPEPRT